MADLYSILPGIEADQQDILEAELEARQILEAEFPDLDLREGTAIRDLVIRPAAFLLAICKKAFDSYFVQNTLSGVSDDTPTEIVDGILGNYFLTRNTGTYAIINARLYFARQKSVAIPSSTSFSTDGSLLFYPPLPIPIVDDAMSYDSYQNEWYYDVDLIAAQTGENYNLSTGSLLYFSNFDPFFLHAEINYLAQASTAAETNLEFIARAGTAISTRNLINVPSIDSNLRQTFNYLDKILTVGSGSDQPYMHRDQIFVNGPRGTAALSTSQAYSHSDTRLRLGLTGHGFIVGQLLDLTEVAGAGWVFRSTPVVEVIDANTFDVLIGFTFTVHTLGQFWITTVEPDLWIHQGGAVDVYVGDTTLVSDEIQYTLNASGKVVIHGPVYNIVRINGLTDTVPTGTSYTTTFAGTTSRGDVTFTQDSGTHVVTVGMPNHGMTVGRLVAVTNWPTNGATMYQPVSSLVDANNFTIGYNLPLYTIAAGTPSVAFVQATGDTGFSMNQALTLDFTSAHANQTVTLDTYYFDKVEAVQNYLSSEENRVICANFLSRGFDIYVLDFALTFYETSLPTTAQIGGILDKLLSGILPGDDFLVSDAVESVVSEGFNKLQTPMTVTAHLYTKDLFPVQNYSITDSIKPISQTCVYILGNVTVTGATL